jgi:hypothetical protein
MFLNLHSSPFFVTKAPRRRYGGAHDVEGGADVVDTTSNRLQRVRPVNAKVSGAAAGNRLELCRLKPGDPPPLVLKWHRRLENAWMTSL